MLLLFCSLTTDVWRGILSHPEREIVGRERSEKERLQLIVGSVLLINTHTLVGTGNERGYRQ